MWSQRMMWVLWPAFLGACVLELVVFALLDPGSLHGVERQAEASNLAVYTVSFFVFWLICIAVGTLTVSLAVPGQPTADDSE